MNMNLVESLKKISTNKELLNKIENSNCSLKDIYDICKEYGFTDSYEVFEEDYEELFAYLINEIKEEELSSVSGGKMNRFFSKSTAALLSALTLSTTAIPMSSAADYNNSKYTNKVVNFVKKNPGKSLALLATAIAVPAGITALGFAGYKLLGGSGEDKIVFNEKEYAQKIKDQIKNLAEKKDSEIEDIKNNSNKSLKDLLLSEIDMFNNHYRNKKNLIDYIVLANSCCTNSILYDLKNEKEAAESIGKIGICLIFFTLLREVKPKKRIAVCNSMKNRLESTTESITDIEDLVDIIEGALTENEIELELKD